jgi:site-specific DNA-methyltransferase (adenine-specific)
MRDIVRDSFLAVRGDRSPDVVIADPDLNQRFLLECQARGLSHSPVVLNQCLLNLRKSSDLQGLRSRRVPLRNQEDYRFASEIAVRFLERRDQINLDQILCDPVKAAEFDTIAADIAPGFSRFQYRWAALNLRKQKGLRPELLGRVVPAEAVVTVRARDVKLTEVPARPGLYLLIERSRVLYVGECQNLRKRLGKHLDHSDNKGLAQWLWRNGSTDLHVEYHVLSAGVSVRVRKAMEAELIRSRCPCFNVAGSDIGEGGSSRWRPSSPSD